MDIINRNIPVINNFQLGFSTIKIKIKIEIKNLIKFALSQIKKEIIIKVIRIKKFIFLNFFNYTKKKFAVKSTKHRKKLPTINSSLKKLAILPG